MNPFISKNKNQPTIHKREAFGDASFYFFLIACNIPHGYISTFPCFPLSTFVNFNSIKMKTAAHTITKETLKDKPS